MSREDDEGDEIEYGVPSGMRIERVKYTMSEAAFRQRREASLSAREKATGPVTPEGKARSRLNALKHGDHAATLATQLVRPCQRTCSAFKKCPHIEYEETRPGDRCPVHLDELFDCISAVSEAVQNGDHGKLRDLAAIRLGGNFQILAEIQEAILDDGPMLLEKIIGDNIIIKYKEHPLLDKLIKLSALLNISPSDFKLTPKSQDGDDEDKTSLASNLAEALANVTRGEKK